MISERIKLLRKELSHDGEKMTQELFADRIDVSRGVIANIENERAEPTDLILKRICKEFHVNPEWLRTGEGEMFEQAATRKAELARFFADVLTEDDDYRRRFLHAWEQLDKRDLAVLARCVTRFMDAYNSYDDNDPADGV